VHDGRALPIPSDGRISGFPNGGWCDVVPFRTASALAYARRCSALTTFGQQISQLGFK
jgi:hypothetical protein